LDQKLQFLSLGLLNGRPSYSRSLQPSKDNIQHFKLFSTIVVIFALPDPDPEPIRIRNIAIRPCQLQRRLIKPDLITSKTATANPYTENMEHEYFLPFLSLSSV
jgi:hypothetical protein